MNVGVSTEDDLRVSSIPRKKGRILTVFLYSKNRQLSLAIRTKIFYFLIFVRKTRIFPSKRILVSKNIFKRDVSQAIFQDVSQSFDVGDIEIFLNGGKQLLAKHRITYYSYYTVLFRFYKR